MEKDEIAAILELVGQAEAFKPVVQQCVKTLKGYGPELDEIFGGINEWSIHQRIKNINLLEEKGFTREEAIYITMDQWWGMKRGLEKKSPK